jgi:hypothetical protein
LIVSIKWARAAFAHCAFTGISGKHLGLLLAELHPAWQARRDDVDRFAAALFGFPCRTSPVWLADARQYFAKFQVDQIDVEISTVERPADTDTFEGIGPGPWEHCAILVKGPSRLAFHSGTPNALRRLGGVCAGLSTRDGSVFRSARASICRPVTAGFP